MKRLLIKLIKFYQKLPIHTHTLCRFTPTCSEYMIESLEYYGALRGLWIGLKRIFRCHPFGKYGYDPVIREEK